MTAGAPGGRPTDPRASFENETADGNAELTRALAVLQRVILRYPAAAQALFQALMREGRAYAATERGAAWKQKLHGTRLIQEGRALWEGITLNALDEKEESVLPGKLLEAFVTLAREGRVEERVRELFRTANSGTAVEDGSDAR